MSVANLQSSNDPLQPPPDILVGAYDLFIRKGMTSKQRAYFDSCVAANDQSCEATPDIVTTAEAASVTTPVTTPEGVVDGSRANIHELLNEEERERKYLENPVPFHIIKKENEAIEIILKNKENITLQLLVDKMEVSQTDAHSILLGLVARNFIDDSLTIIDEENYLKYIQNAKYLDVDFTSEDKKFYVEKLNEYLDTYINSSTSGIVITDYDDIKLKMTEIKKLLPYLEDVAPKKEKILYISLEDLCKNMLYSSGSDGTMEKEALLSPEKMIKIEKTIEEAEAIIKELTISIESMPEGSFKEMEEAKLERMKKDLKKVMQQLNSQ